MRRVFVDTSVLVYAVGAAHPHRDACRRLLAAAQRGDLALHASVELVQELVSHRMRRGPRSAAVSQGRAAAELLHLHPFDPAVLEQALDLVAAGELGGRDAVHAATALLAGFDGIVSTDRDFDGVVRLARISPSDVLG